MADVIADGEDIIIAATKPGALNQDAFGRYRTSTPYTLFEFNSFQDILFSDLFNYFEDLSTGSGSVTHNNTRHSYLLDPGSSSGDTAVAQTKAYWRYQSGKSQLIITSFIFGAGVANTAKRVGYFDPSDGIFLEQDGTDINVVLRSSVSGSVVERRIPQSSWSFDTLDGTGGTNNCSGIDLDFTKTQLFVCDFQWLGVGLVRFGFEIDGQFRLAHVFKNTNVLDELYMTSGSLPLRYEVENTGAFVAGTMEFMCGVVLTEAASSLADLYGATWDIDYDDLTNISAEEPIIAIRLKQTFKSNDNNGFVIPGNITCYGQDRDYRIKAYYNASVTGGTWVSTNADSMVEYNLTGTGFSGGRRVLSQSADRNAIISTSSGIISSERLTYNSAGSDIFLVTADSLGGSTDIFASLNWKEFLR